MTLSESKVGGQVPPESVRGDAELAQSVRLALEWDEFVPHGKISVSASGGTVALDGTLSDQSDKEYAERIVRLLVGVRGVENRIRIESKRDGRGRRSLPA